MRFTADMEEFEEERFTCGALYPARRAEHARPPSPAGQEAGEARVRGAREEQLLGPAARPRALRLRGLDIAERTRLRQEAQLLAALEVAGVEAAPAVLEVEEQGYLRETASLMARCTGRRSAEPLTPPTGEREATARAREQLDVLLDALHERGWVLGAARGGGLGRRADGSVVVLDLEGLRQDETLAARREDRLWADSVLADQDRTLRRSSPTAAPPPAEPPPAESSAAEPPPWPQPRRLRRRIDDVRTAQEAEGEAAPRRDPHRARGGAVGGAATAAAARGRRGAARALQATAEVLRRPRLRRIALLSGTAVLLCGALVLLGAHWAMPVGEDERAAPSPATEARAAAPEITEPWELAAELAGTRHAYLTGTSPVAASVAGSTAREESDRVRAAYAGVTVRGGGPVVHEAELLSQSAEEGTASLRVVSSVAEHETESADGTVTTIPASAPEAVVLHLAWSGSTWQVREVREEAGTG